MDKSRTPPQNRYTRSAAKKINTPSSKTKTKENEDESKEDVNLSIRKTRRRSENKPKSNGDTAVDTDSKKLKSTSDMSDGNTLGGFESENSMSSEKQSKSPKECNLKTPSPTISRKSLRLRRSITPGPEVESNTPKRMRRSTSMTQLEPKSTQRNRRAQSVNKDFIYSPSKVNQESGMSESRSCFKLSSIGKIEECNEEDSSQDEYLSKYVEKSNLVGNNKSPANNTSPTNSKVETDILINDETDSTSEPTSTSSNTADSELGPAHTVLHLIEEDTVKVTDEQNVQLITQDVVIGKPMSYIFTADKSELSPNVNLLPGMKAGDIHVLPQFDVEIVMSDDDETDSKKESNSNERCQNLAVLPKIDEEDSAIIADEQIIQPVERNVIVTSKPRISKAGKIELSPTVKVLPVIKEEDSVDGKKQTVSPNFGTIVNTGREKATSKESEDLPKENSYLDTTSDNILKETLYEGTVENNPVKSIDYLEKDQVTDDSNSMEVEAISDDELVEGKSVIKRSRSEFQISNVDASSEYGEISTIQSNNSVIFKNVSPGLKSIPVQVTRIYENNNDTFIQTFQNETEEIEIRNQEIDLQNREGSSSIVETFECSIVNTQSGLNSHLSQSTVDPLQDHRNVYETVSDENNDCEKSDNVDVSKIILSEEQKSINEDFCYEAVKANTEDDNCREDKEGNKSLVLEYEEHDEVHEIVDDENSPDFGIQDDQMSHVEPKSANDDAYNGCESHLQRRVIDYIEDREEEVVIQFRSPSESDNVAKKTFQSQQNSNLTLEDNSPSNRLFSHNKTVSESDEQLGHQLEKNYKSSNDVEIINDTSSECSEANSDIYKDLSDCGISEQLGSPSNNYNDKYVSDNEEEDEEEGGEELEHEIEDSEDKGEELEEEEGEEECEDECEDECEEGEEGEEDREEEDEEEIKEGGDKVAKNPVSTLKDKEIKNEIPSSFQINASQKNENVFDKEHPITYEKALEILNKDREKKINDDEFFEMYTEELRKVSAEEASDSDLQIVDEWIPENLPKPKPVIKGIKRPPQRPPSSMPRQPITPFHKLEAPFKAQTPYRVQTPYRGQVPQHQIPLHNLPQMQGLNYPQEGLYNPFNAGMTHMDSSRGPMMYNQFGAPNHNLPDPRICGPGNTMDNFSQPGMFNHPLGHMSELAVQYNAQEIKARNTGAMIRNNHLSSNQGFPAEPGKVSVPEFPEMNSSGSNPTRNSSNLAANITNSGVSTPKKQVIKQKSNTSTSEDGDKIDTPVLNVLNLKPEQILHLKKVLGVIDKSSDEKMRARRPYTKKNINSKQRSHVLETTEDESEILTNKKEMTKEYLKRFLKGDRTLPASLRKAYNNLKPRPDRQVNLEGGSVAVTVAQKRKKWKKVKKLDRDRILLKEKRKRRKHNRRQKRDNMTSEDSSCSDSSNVDNFEKLLMLNKKLKMAENLLNSSSSSEAPRSSKQLKRSYKCFSDRLTTHEKVNFSLY